MTKAFHFTPFRFKRLAAAHYTGMSAPSFDRAVEAGQFPLGKKDIGGIYWLREDLDAGMLGKAAKKHDFRQPV